MAKGFTHDGKKVITKVRLTGKQSGDMENLKLFLESQRALQKFQRNCSQPTKGYIKSDHLRFEYVISQNEEIDLIFNEAFTWDETPEGRRYWDNLDGEWRDICEKKGFV
jgi:hypothetical protein